VEHLIGLYFEDKLRTLFAKIRLGRECLGETNALAYFNTVVLIPNVKSCIILSPKVFVRVEVLKAQGS
jgi:hypothetical protein